jgi:GTP1/Obg family GTP-binding protein
MSYRWMTTKDLSAAVRERDIMNSRVKRKEIEEPKHFTYVVCGCGEEGYSSITTCMTAAYPR